MLDTNVLAVAVFTKTFTPGMIARNRCVGLSSAVLRFSLTFSLTLLAQKCN
jgi:NADP-dependent 3-hydroxy acid dehydrogenase YdfG